MKKKILYIVLSIILIGVFLYSYNDDGDDADGWESARSYVGAACRKCDCEEYRGHINKKGILYSPCVDCHHSPSDHGIDEELIINE